MQNSDQLMKGRVDEKPCWEQISMGADFQGHSIFPQIQKGMAFLRARVALEGQRLSAQIQPDMSSTDERPDVHERPVALDGSKLVRERSPLHDLLPRHRDLPLRTTRLSTFRPASRLLKPLAPCTNRPQGPVTARASFILPSALFSSTRRPRPRAAPGKREWTSGA